MTRKEANRIATAINDGFSEELKRAFKGRFWLDIETNFNIFAVAMVTTRVDGENLTQAQADFIAIFEAGYFAARQVATVALEAK